MDRELAVSDLLTMNQIINQSSMDADFEATLLASFAGVSLLLAAVGLFGVLAYLVASAAPRSVSAWHWGRSENRFCA